MAEERDMGGILSKNEKREKDTHPHYNGKCVIGGVKYWISAWKKDGQYGPFLSLSFKAREQQQRQPGEDNDLAY